MIKKIEKSNNTITHMDGKQDRKLDIKEGFDGIRKSNSRIIFTILLGIIILDVIYECMN